MHGETAQPHTQQQAGQTDVASHFTADAHALGLAVALGDGLGHQPLHVIGLGDVADHAVRGQPIRTQPGRRRLRQFLLDIARSANDASILVREAWDKYESPIDYGIAGLDLPKVAALIDAGLPTSLYYVAYRNNAFDTHVFQNDLHQRLLTYTSDAVSGFMQDLERIGRADDVVVMIFSEFGRRVPENVSLGTDHGAANVMFVVGNNVKGGHYGEIPSLTALTEGDNLVYTTDFRRVYQTMMQGWLGQRDTAGILNGDFGSFEMFV